MITFLLVCSCVTSCSSSPPRRSQSVPVMVSQVILRNVPYEIEATGTVEPLRSADVRAQVSGLITRVAFREGDQVRSGQVLFQIDPRPLQAAADRAAAVLARDRAQSETARLEFERAQALAEKQVISTEELDSKRSNAQAMAATARADSAALASARLDLAYATIRAPISGKSGNLFFNIGDLARANDGAGNPLVTINQIDPILVRFVVPQADLTELHRQQSRGLRVDVAPAEHDSAWIEGRLVFVDNQVDQASGTLLLKGEFPNRQGPLWPGQFVRVRLRLSERKDATVMPAVAVTNSQKGSYVYVVKPDTTVEARPVTVDRIWRDLAVIASGVAPGETVVTDGQLRLSPGAKAVIRESAGPGATP